MAQSERVLIHAPQVAAEAAQRRRHFWSAENPWFWLTPAIIFLMSYSIFPLIYNVILSFHEFHKRKKIFEYVGTENWTQLFTSDQRFANSLGVTLQYVIIALVIQLILGLIIALMLDARPWGAGIMQALIILPMVTAPAVTGMLFRLLTHSEFGVIDWLAESVGLVTKNEPLVGGTGRYALAGILIAEIWQWTPFFVLIILAGLKGLPGEVLEAAEVDGANWWQRLVRIKLPLLRAVLTVAILFRVVDLYKVFDYVVILTAGGPATRTETVSFYGYVNTFQQVNWGYGATIGLTIMVAVWVTAFAFQKIFKIQW